MAGVDSHGAFSSFARTQYAALARMRWNMFRNGLRSVRGAAELGASIFVGVLFAIVGLGISAGLSAGSYAIVHSGKTQLLPILFWAVFFLWQMLPITIASFQQQFEVSGLLRFPVSFGAFYLLIFTFGLIDVSTLMGALCSLGILIGVTAAQPSLFPVTLLALCVFGAFNVLLSRAIFSWIERWLAQRRTREIVMALFFCAILAMNFFNPAFRGHPGGSWVGSQSQAAIRGSLHTADAIQRWLPPGLAAQSLGNATKGQPVPLLLSFLLLGTYTLTVGSVLAVRLKAEYRGENLGAAPSRQKAERRTGPWLLDGSGPMAAVIEKEARTILRALILVYALAAPLVFVFIFAGLFRSKSIGNGNIPWGFLVCLAYAIVGFTQLIYNNLGAEGAGIQILFLSPTPIRTVFLAKNVFHAVLFLIDAALVILLASLRYGLPDPVGVAAVAAWALFALPTHLVAGNFLSVGMAYKLNLGRLGRQKGSQLNALLSMLSQLVVLGIGAGVLFGCSYFHRVWLAVPVFLLLAAIAAVVWLRTLGPVERMFYSRREALLATLVRAE